MTNVIIDVIKNCDRIHDTVKRKNIKKYNIT